MAKHKPVPLRPVPFKLLYAHDYFVTVNQVLTHPQFPASKKLKILLNQGSGIHSDHFRAFAFRLVEDVLTLTSESQVMSLLFLHAKKFIGKKKKELRDFKVPVYVDPLEEAVLGTILASAQGSPSKAAKDAAREHTVVRGICGTERQDIFKFQVRILKHIIKEPT